MDDVGRTVIVLIAEDEKPIAEFISSIVEDMGYVPVVARHGRQALELAHAQAPALLITDLMMPYMSGADLIAALRTEAAVRGQAAVPIILMTAAGAVHALAAGADAVLYKPFDLIELEDLVEKLLSAPPPLPRETS